MIARAIDHVVALVRDLDAAAERWMRLGFVVTPRGLHSAHMGTANHCIMFDHDYVELLGVLRPTEGNAPWRAQMERREGLGAVALATEDAEATRAALAVHGLSAGAVLDFARPVKFAGGEAEAAFAVTRTTGFEADGLDLFFCQHNTRDAVWRDEWRDHPNGATGLAAVDLVVTDIAGARGRLAMLFALDSVADTGTGFTIAAGSVEIRVEAGAAAHLRGLAIRALDLDHVAATLETGAVAHTHRPRSIEVAAPEATGVALSFVE